MCQVTTGKCLEQCDFVMTEGHFSLEECTWIHKDVFREIPFSGWFFWDLTNCFENIMAVWKGDGKYIQDHVQILSNSYNIPSFFTRVFLKVIQNHSQMNFKKCLILAALNYVEESSWFNETPMGDLTRIAFALCPFIAESFVFLNKYFISSENGMNFNNNKQI